MSLFGFGKKKEGDTVSEKKSEDKTDLVSDRFCLVESRADEIIKEIMFMMLIDSEVKSAGDLITSIRNKYTGDEREFALFVSGRASEALKAKMEKMGK